MFNNGTKDVSIGFKFKFLGDEKIFYSELIFNGFGNGIVIVRKLFGMPFLAGELLKVELPFVYTSLDDIRRVDGSIDIEKLELEVFDIYKGLKLSYMEFDYDGLRKYSSDRLYNYYCDKLKILFCKGKKNIIRDIKFINNSLIELSIDGNFEKIKMRLVVEEFDYVVNKFNMLVRGYHKEGIKLNIM